MNITMNEYSEVPMINDGSSIDCVCSILKFPLFLSAYKGLMTLSSMKDRRLTGTMRKRSTVDSGQN